MLRAFGSLPKPLARCGLALAMLAAFGDLPARSSDTTLDKVFHHFTGGSDGGVPSGELIADRKGNLYGTTQFGGSFNSGCAPVGCGTVFRVSLDRKETVLHAFTGGSDGGFPFAGLIFDRAGNLYGTTSGYYGSVGTVFKLAPDGSKTILYTFKGGTDGFIPWSTLVADQDGNLYGTTQFGGDMTCGHYGCGTVFKVTRKGKETVLHAFHGAPDGAYLAAALVRDSTGNLYGTAYSGGTGVAANCPDDQSGCGGIFKITPDGTETMLYNFAGGSDGAGPRDTLLMDGSGNLYGTTEYGGNCNSDNICGTVFKLPPHGTETVLYRFQGGNDGGSPYGGVIMDKAGNLYGTTAAGGGGCQDHYGCGTVFKLAPDGGETVLQTFLLGREGQAPEASLIESGKGILYGTTVAGSHHNSGVVFGVRAD